jgi:hypothetical protein
MTGIKNLLHRRIFVYKFLLGGMVLLRHWNDTCSIIIKLMYMTVHARLLQALFIELTKQGFDTEPRNCVQSVNENLREMHRLTGRTQISRFQLAAYAEAGHWLYRISTPQDR